MTKLPVIVVYCQGPPDATHDRYIIAAYQRSHTTETPTPALWVPLREYRGVRLRNVEHYRHTTAPGFTDRRAWLGFRFRCGRCPLDEKRSEDDRRVGDRIYAVFDGLWRHGVDPLEISALGLLREIGR